VGYSVRVSVLDDYSASGRFDVVCHVRWFATSKSTERRFEVGSGDDGNGRGCCVLDERRNVLTSRFKRHCVRADFDGRLGVSRGV